MCFTIFRCGYIPRCALDFSDSGQPRFNRILDLILACGLSVHDISRVQPDRDSQLPRFNMPLELGADLGLRLKGPVKQRDRRLLILEAEKHRYDITISDLSGQDIEAHHDSEAQIITRVRDWLNAGRNGERPLPGAETIQAGYSAFLRMSPAIIAAEGLDALEYLPHADFLWAVRATIAHMESQSPIAMTLDP
jgi:hypothetical protein